MSLALSHHLLALASGHSAGGLIQDLVIILAAAGIVALVMQRLRLAVIPAYLLTGALIGPGGLEFIPSAESVRAIADLALILLLFGIGLHMDLSILRANWRQLSIASMLSVVLTFVVLIPLAFLFQPDLHVAITLAMAMTMSSTAVVLRIIQQRRELHHVDGRLAFSVLILQDLAAIVALMLLPPLAQMHGSATPGLFGASDGSGPSALTQLALNGFVAVVGILSLILIGKYVLPKVLHEAARQRTGEAMIVISTAAALGAAALTDLVGISPALGAFLGGFMLSSTPFRHQLSGQVGTIRDLFAAVFFTSIGMAVSFEVVLEFLPSILAGAIVLVFAKALFISLSVWLAGSTGPVSLKVGLTLAQAGEFGIVILSAAENPEIGLIGDELFDRAVAVIVLTLMFTPAILWLAPVLVARLPHVPAPPWWRRHASVDASLIVSDTDRPLRVIIAGFGVVGRAVADSLMARGADVTIVELNPQTVRTQARLGRHIVFGDISNTEVMASTHIEDADALILTFPDENAVLRAITAARRACPDMTIIVRTGFLAKGMAATQLGATAVVVEEMATAQAMEEAVEQRLGQMLTDRARSAKGADA